MQHHPRHDAIHDPTSEETTGGGASSPAEYVTGLLSDDRMREAFAADPQGHLAEHGLAELSRDDVLDTVEALRHQLPPAEAQKLDGYLATAGSPAGVVGELGKLTTDHAVRLDPAALGGPGERLAQPDPEPEGAAPGGNLAGTGGEFLDFPEGREGIAGPEGYDPPDLDTPREGIVSPEFADRGEVLREQGFTGPIPDWASSEEFADRGEVLRGQSVDAGIAPQDDLIEGPEITGEAAVDGGASDEPHRDTGALPGDELHRDTGAIPGDELHGDTGIAPADDLHGESAEPIDDVRDAGASPDEGF